MVLVAGLRHYFSCLKEEAPPPNYILLLLHSDVVHSVVGLHLDVRSRG